MKELEAKAQLHDQEKTKLQNETREFNELKAKKKELLKLKQIGQNQLTKSNYQLK